MYQPDGGDFRYAALAAAAGDEYRLDVKTNVAGSCTSAMHG